MEMLLNEWDIFVRVIAAIISFAIVIRVVTFKAIGKTNRRGVSVIAWAIIVFASAQGIAAIFSEDTIPLSSLGISTVLLYTVLVTKGNIAPILRSHENDMV